MMAAAYHSSTHTATVHPKANAGEGAGLHRGAVVHSVVNLTREIDIPFAVEVERGVHQLELE